MCCSWVTWLTSAGALLCMKQMSMLVTQTDWHILTSCFNESKHPTFLKYKVKLCAASPKKFGVALWSHTELNRFCLCSILKLYDMKWDHLILNSHYYDSNVMYTGITHTFTYRNTGLDIPNEQRTMGKNKYPLVEYQFLWLNCGWMVRGSIQNIRDWCCKNYKTHPTADWLPSPLK
jgi:hypothetical protein